MSKLEELIAKLCPNGVEYVSNGRVDVCEQFLREEIEG